MSRFINRTILTSQLSDAGYVKFPVDFSESDYEKLYVDISYQAVYFDVQNNATLSPSNLLMTTENGRFRDFTTRLMAKIEVNLDTIVDDEPQLIEDYDNQMVMFYRNLTFTNNAGGTYPLKLSTGMVALIVNKAEGYIALLGDLPPASSGGSTLDDIDIPMTLAITILDRVVTP